MGPTNTALLSLYNIDQELRAAQARFDAAAKNIRLHEARVTDFATRKAATHKSLLESQSASGQIELDIKTRDARIEKLRSQQQNAKNNKEYQAFLVEINTEKVDKAKAEDEQLKRMEEIEKKSAELADLNTQHDSEAGKLATLKSELTDRLAALQQEVDTIKPRRQAAASALSPKIVDTFERIAERHDGEALAPIQKPDRRREEYVCGGCQLDLVVDVYNKLHTRDDLVFCKSCGRILYIPDDLPPDVAVKKRKPAKEPKAAGTVAAAAPLQQSAAAVRDSINQEAEPSAAESSPAADDGSIATAPADASSLGSAES